MVRCFALTIKLRIFFNVQINIRRQTIRDTRISGKSKFTLIFQLHLENQSFVKISNYGRELPLQDKPKLISVWHLIK